MSLITRQGKGSKLTTQEMDNNLLYLQSLGYSENPIVQAYLIAKEYTPYLDYYGPNEIVPFSYFGMVVPYQEGMILPDTGFYAIASVETHLKLAEALYQQNPKWQFIRRLFKIDSTTKSCGASVETYLKLNEAYNYWGAKPGFNREFVESFQNLNTYDSKAYGSYEYFDRITDKGIVELGAIEGKSQIDTLIDLSSVVTTGNFSSSVENLDRMLDLGIVVLDAKKFPMFFGLQDPQYPKNGLLVMSVEQCLRYIEFVINPYPA
jgi:hypothetical protein